MARELHIWLPDADDISDAEQENILNELAENAAEQYAIQYGEILEYIIAEA